MSPEAGEGVWCTAGGMNHALALLPPPMTLRGEEHVNSTWNAVTMIPRYNGSVDEMHGEMVNPEQWNHRMLAPEERHHGVFHEVC